MPDGLPSGRLHFWECPRLQHVQTDSIHLGPQKKYSRYPAQNVARAKRAEIQQITF